MLDNKLNSFVRLDGYFIVVLQVLSFFSIPRDYNFCDRFPDLWIFSFVRFYFFSWYPAYSFLVYRKFSFQFKSNRRFSHRFFPSIVDQFFRPNICTCIWRYTYACNLCKYIVPWYISVVFAFPRVFCTASRAKVKLFNANERKERLNDRRRRERQTESSENRYQTNKKHLLAGWTKVFFPRLFTLSYKSSFVSLYLTLDAVPNDLSFTFSRYTSHLLDAIRRTHACFAFDQWIIAKTVNYRRHS